MINVETVLNGYLSAYAGLTALVGTRIYSIAAPETTGNEVAYLVHFPVSDMPDETLQGESGMREVYEQISCFAPSGSGAAAVADQVQLAMKAWPRSGSGIGPVHRVNRIAIKEPDMRLYHVMLEYLIQVKE